MCRIIAAGVLAGFIPAAVVSAPGPPLSFRIDEGRNINSFVRDGEVAAHLVLRSGTAPRILVAFPAGNSGVAVWFAQTERNVSWTLIGSPRPLSTVDEKGRSLHGIVVEVAADTAALRIERALLSSVRVLRNYQSQGTAPTEILVSPTPLRNGISWARDRLDGAPGYRLSLEALDDTTVDAGLIRRGTGDRLRLRILALTGEQPLTPLEAASLLTATARHDQRERDVLAFLSYREKYLAGSWRFNTYFGRDTLMSLALLAPALQPLALESGIASVLARLSPDGQVAHEEDIGEFAVLRNLEEGRGRSDKAIYDYGMVDESFMLAPVATGWLLESAIGRRRAPLFLARRNPSGLSQGDALVRNFQWVLQQTIRFAADPGPTTLVGIKEGRASGQWRDSDEGLSGGRYPYDVNAVFVPAALDAIDRLLQSGLLDPYLSRAQRQRLLQAGAQLRTWSQRAPPLFEVQRPVDRARADVERYAAALGVDAKAALASLGEGPLVFNALSLDAQGRPIAVMHSDDGFALLFGMPTFDQLGRTLETITRPFPAGLWTPIGVLVANPAFAGGDTQARFTNGDYHGTVVWSWQQAVLAAGLNRQLARTDLPSALREQLARARAAVWSAINAAAALRTSELWSWSFSNGCYHIEPFGAHSAHVDESNAAQLWSTVFLAIPVPRRSAGTARGCMASASGVSKAP